MAISRETKQQQVAQMTDALAKSRLTVVADYKGLTVAQMQALRGELKAENSAVQIAKNNLIKLALSQAKVAPPTADLLTGPSALAYGYADEVTVAQIIAKFGKEYPALQIKAGLTAEGNWLSAEEVKHLASLPNHEQLLGQLVGTLAAPVSGFVRVLAANISGLVNVLNNIKAAA
ncbi:50S ribosomal protein L10 [Candidatus Microgenomates bacterium]|nr:50S ribosomal protein L10 [Candidatus Microgenomates bacterium]